MLQRPQRVPGLVVIRHDHRHLHAVDEPELRRQGFHRQAVEAACRQLPQQIRHIQGLRALLPVQQREVALDGLGGQRLRLELPEHFSRLLRVLLEFRWRCPIRIARQKHKQLAGIPGAPSLPVAAASGLGDGVQARLGTQHGGKVHVNSGLDQARRYQPAGFAFLEHLPHFGQHLAAVPGTHQRGQMACAGQIGHGLVDGPRMAAVVDDAQHLFARAHVPGQRLVVQHAQVPHAHALQLREQPVRVGRQLPHFVQAALEIWRHQCRLGRGA